MNSFGNKVREWRKAKNISQLDFAKRVGTNNSQLQRWESLGYPPRADWALKIAKEMGTTVEYLVNESIPNRLDNPPAPPSLGNTEQDKLILYYLEMIGKEEAVRRLMRGGENISKIEVDSITDQDYKNGARKEARKKA